MIRKAGLILIGITFSSAVSFADVISLDTNPSDFNDTVTWSQLGPDSTNLNSAFSATSTAGKSISGSLSSGSGLVVVDGNTWSGSGAFSVGDSLIWAFDSGQNAGTGPLTFTFPSGFGAGAAIQSDAPGQFTAKIELFDGATSLGDVTLMSDTAGDAIFIGAVDNLPNVTRAVFSLMAAPANSNTQNPTGDFALDTLYLQNQVQVNGVPEPNSVLLLTGVVAALGYKLRRARRPV